MLFYFTIEDLPFLFLQKNFHRLKKDILSLETMPLRFALIDEEPYKSMGVRCIPIENYTAFYIADETAKTIHILRVLYNRRDWQAIL